MDEVMYVGIAFAAAAWGVARLIEAGTTLHNHIQYWRHQ